MDERGVLVGVVTYRDLAIRVIVQSRIVVVGDDCRALGVVSLSDIAQIEAPARAGRFLRRIVERETPSAGRRRRLVNQRATPAYRIQDRTCKDPVRTSTIIAVGYPHKFPSLRQLSAGIADWSQFRHSIMYRRMMSSSGYRACVVNAVRFTKAWSTSLLHQRMYLFEEDIARGQMLAREMQSMCTCLYILRSCICL